MNRLSSKAMRTAPKRIWLQLGDDPEASRCNFSELGEVTWSTAQETHVCLEYVRADLVRAAMPANALTQRPPSAPEPIRDWPEDAAHENGNYQNECVTCGRLFTGHKRRVLCRACADPVAPVGVEHAARRAATYLDHTNVEHHTAAQAAEIDALRTRLEDTVRDSTNEIEALRADLADYMRIANTEAARAERLEDNLRKVEHLLSCTPRVTRDMYVGRDRVAWGVQAAELLAEIKALLREQEEGK